MDAKRLALLCVGALLAACGGKPHPTTTVAGGAATTFTEQANRDVAAALPIGDPQDMADAKRGFVATDDPLLVLGPGGMRTWDFDSYKFIDGDAPPTVNPSLWRQAKLNNQHGLFEVVPGIHQVRGYDISNMTLIEGKTGWILVDPLTSNETAAAALALARKHLGDRPVSAIIFTHSHVDHFGGVASVLPSDPGAAARIPIVAPRNFMEESTSENVLAGIAMGRRATYMYGTFLPRSPTGHVDTGLGKGPAVGTVSIREPTIIVDRTPQEMELDGVKFVFQYAPESEAPAELTFYLPDLKAWCGAEIVTHTLHNLYTLRGAKVRNAVKWSGYIDDALHRFGDMEVVFASHHWPMWGNARILDYLKAQRDTYLYIHDQTLRLANEGYTPQEIAEQVELPSTLRTRFANRGYYGTVRHNAKAVYQAYFGWYDGNPANLDPLPPVEAGKKYVEAMGGAAEVLKKGKAAADAGDYRWAAMMLNHLVFAEPSNKEAKDLLASVYDQLGYRAEAGPWRDVYLTGAYELRNGVQGTAANPKFAMALLRETPPARFFDSMAVRLKGPDADGKHLKFNFIFDDLKESHVVELEDAVLHHRQADPVPDADATVHLTRELMVQLGAGEAGLKDLVMSDDLEVEGSRLKLLSFLSLISKPDGQFPIVTP
ncbi:MAG: MBL fold metallo-hydrolase [Gammaproteobacteria bacterium]|nr:MBL fold metallo-hydrolase [Gammaproteobacteria bacterium]